MRLRHRSILIRTVILILPVFFAWHLLVNHTVIPAVAGAADYAIKSLYSHLKPRLFFQETTQSWELETALFRSDIPYDNNTYKPNFSVTSPTVLVIGKLEAFTLGLPLFWILLLVSSAFTLRHLLQGSIIITTIICLNLVLLVSHKIIDYLKGSPLIRVFDHPYILKPPVAPSWFIEIIKPLLDTLVFLNILVIPACLAYYYYLKLSSDKHEQHAEKETAQDAPHEESV